MTVRPNDFCKSTTPGTHALLAFGLFLLLIFSWRFIETFRFNSLASQLFFGLLAASFYALWLVELRVSRLMLCVFAAWVGWMFFVDARSAEFLPALAKDVEWMILPIFVMLLSTLMRRHDVYLLTLQLAAAGSLLIIGTELHVRSEWVVNWSVAPLFGNIRHLGLSVGALALFLYSVEGRYSAYRWWLRFARLVGLVLLVWSGTRSAILAWLLGFLLMVAFSRELRRCSWLYAEVLLAIALSVVFAVDSPATGLYAGVVRSAGATTVESLSSARLSMWVKTIEALSCSGSLLMGVGGNGFARLGISQMAIEFQPHNIVIQTIADWGFIGLGISLGYVAFLSWRLASRAVAANALPTIAPWLGYVVYFLITGMLDATLYHLEHLIYLSAGLAALYAAIPEDNSVAKVVVPRGIVAVGLALACVLHWAMLDYHFQVRVAPRSEPPPQCVALASARSS